MSETFTKEEVQAQISAAVAEATRPLTEELESFKSSQETAEVEARIAEAKAEAEAQVTALQAELDAKVIEADAAVKAHTELVELLEAEEARVTEEAAVAARIEERTAAVAEVVEFSEEYVASNAARWAAMDDESFEATIADYAAVAEKASASVGGSTKVPAKTALTASRDEDKGVASAAKGLFALQRGGFDPRSMV